MGGVGCVGCIGCTVRYKHEAPGIIPALRTLAPTAPVAPYRLNQYDAFMRKVFAGWAEKRFW